jgi:hypothetical protein
MDISKLFGQDAASKLKAAEDLVTQKKTELADAEDLVTQKKTELADAEAALSALQPSASGTVGEDGVTGGRGKKSRRGGKKSRKLTLRRK